MSKKSTLSISSIFFLLAFLLLGTPFRVEAAPTSVNQILSRTNMERKKRGLPALRVNEKLSRAAQRKANEMARLQYFDHQSPSGKTVKYLLASVKYKWSACAENIGLSSAAHWDAVRQWMQSSGHQKNILNARYKEIGVGVASGTWRGHQVQFAVQEFGTAKQ